MGYHKFTAKLQPEHKWVKTFFGRLLYKILSNRGNEPDVPFIVDFYGFQYEGNLNNNVDFGVFYYGAYEKPLLYFMRDVIKRLDIKDSVFLDVGANVGQHSLFLAPYVNSIHAFEPYKKVCDRLEYHILCNNIRNITVHNLALGEFTKKCLFFAPTGQNQGTGSFDLSSRKKGNLPIGLLPIVRGDEYLSTLELKSIQLMKIDVEGLEKHVIIGLNSTLEKFRPIVVSEISYGESWSFESLADIYGVLPENYELFVFNIRKADGSKARRKGAKAKRSGNYQLVPYQFAFQDCQEDIVACPSEFVHLLPLTNL